MIRAMAVNSSQLVTYNTAKETLLSTFNTKEETKTIRLMASALSGIAVAVASLPFDNIKTKLMRMQKSSDQNIQRKRGICLTPGSWTV